MLATKLTNLQNIAIVAEKSIYIFLPYGQVSK